MEFGFIFYSETVYFRIWVENFFVGTAKEDMTKNNSYKKKNEF